MSSGGGKLKPHLDEKSTKVLNLTVLQRVDPFVEDILITASHVTFYSFDIHNEQWSRKDVEGSLFVVKRNTQPRFQFIVMNRLNTDNLVEDLLGDFEYEVQTPYLLYRNSTQDVNGIWFYNARDCEELANLFSRILHAYSKVPTKLKSKVSSPKSDFEELEAVPSLAVMDGPLEKSSSTTNVTDIPDDRAFVNFFSTAMNIGSAQNVATPVHPYHSAATMVSSHPQNVALPTLPSAHIPSTLSTSTPIMHILDKPDPITAMRRSTDLMTSLFGPPSSSSSSLIVPPVALSMPTGPPLNTPGNVQRPYGTPLLQPFPPPTPPPSLTPAPASNYGPVIDREKVREALQMLVQDNQFIDLVYQAVLKAHQS